MQCRMLMPTPVQVMTVATSSCLPTVGVLCLSCNSSMHHNGEVLFCASIKVEEDGWHDVLWNTNHCLCREINVRLHHHNNNGVVSYLVSNLLPWFGQCGVIVRKCLYSLVYHADMFGHMQLFSFFNFLTDCQWCWDWGMRCCSAYQCCNGRSKLHRPIMTHIIPETNTYFKRHSWSHAPQAPSWEQSSHSLSQKCPQGKALPQISVHRLGLPSLQDMTCEIQLCL